MKYIIALGFVAIMGVAVSLNVGTVTEVTKVTQEVSTTTPAEVYPQEWLEEAEVAKKAVLQRKQTEADLDDVNSQIETLEAKKEELEKTLGLY